MKLKLKWDFKKVFRNVLWTLLAVAFIITVGFTDTRRHEMLCSGLNISINDTTGNYFIDRNDILRTVEDKFGKLRGKLLRNINTALLESIINSNAFVARAEVFSTADGKLSIEVKQRNPVMRVINGSNESFYVDDEGAFMPLSEKYSADVTVANGFIPNTFAQKKIRTFTREESADTSAHLSLLEELFVLNQFIGTHEFWNAQIEQMYVNDEGDIELVPRVGNHIIVFGDTQNMTEKFDKLFHFYTEGLNHTGWNQYKIINLKFKDQVVCTKK